jgi:hypothetical protein
MVVGTASSGKKGVGFEKTGSLVNDLNAVEVAL